jgi:hypothetical protein
MPTPTTEEIRAISKRVAEVLAGHPAEVQGAVLADLLAMWLAGHHSPGDEDWTRQWRADLLAMHCSMVRLLVPVNARMIGTTP